jgi:chromosome segregation ATPase
MSGEPSTTAELDRLDAALLEQRRLAHLVRRRGDELHELQVAHAELRVREQHLARLLDENGEKLEAVSEARRVLEQQLEGSTALRDELVARIASLEAELAGLHGTIDAMAADVRRARDARTWRWGHALARFARALTFRRGSRRSALDAALARAARIRGAGDR